MAVLLVLIARREGIFVIFSKMLRWCAAYNYTNASHLSSLVKIRLLPHFPNDSSTIFIRSVNFIERKFSLDSELSEFEGIIVIGDIYWILERSATD